MSSSVQPVEASLIESLLDYVQYKQKINRDSIRNCTTTCESTSNTTAEETSSNNKDFYSMTSQDWFLCLQQFLLSNIGYARKRDHDTCTSECCFFNYKDWFYVCRHSGRIHRCTAQLCDQLDETAEASVCRLTCASYPCEMEPDIDQERIQQNRALKNVTKQNKKTIEQSARDTEIKEAMTSMKRKKGVTELTSDERKEVRKKFGYKRKEVLIDRHVKTSEALSLVKKALPNQALQYDTIVQEMVDTWIQVQHNLQHNHTEKSEYNFFYHCLAVLYMIKNGGFEGFVSYNTVVYDHLPTKKQLATKMKDKNISCNRITTAGRILSQHLQCHEEKNEMSDE
jgi:hypothetical protein